MSEVVVKLGQYKGIKCPETNVEVTKEEIDAQIEASLNSIGLVTTQSVEGPAQLGDTTVIDFTGYLNGEKFEGGEGSEYPLKLGSGQFIPGFEEQLVGAMQDAEVDVNVTFPEQYPAPDLAGQPVVFKVVVRDIMRTQAPEVTDELVKDMPNDMTTAAEFYEAIERGIKNQKASQAAQNKENFIMQMVISKSEINVPEDIINERAELMKNQVIAGLQQQGATLDMYLAQYQATIEDFEVQIAREAEMMLEGQAVLRAIADEEGLDATEEDIEAEFVNAAAMYGITVEEFKETIGDANLKLVAEDVRFKKALKFIVDNSIEVE